MPNPLLVRAEAGLASPGWSAASYGRSADTSAAELSSLSEHLHLCRFGGRRATLRGALHTARTFVAARVVTSIAALAIAGAIGWLVVG